MSKLRTLMNAHGFYLTGTGGGCTAYSRMDEDGTSWLITKENDVDAPTRLGQRVTIGRYPGGGEPLFAVATSVHQALCHPSLNEMMISSDV